MERGRVMHYVTYMELTNNISSLFDMEVSYLPLRIEYFVFIDLYDYSRYPLLSDQDDVKVCCFV